MIASDHPTWEAEQPSVVIDRPFLDDRALLL